MNGHLKALLTDAKLNIAVLLVIVLAAIVGKMTDPAVTNTILEAADQLSANLILVLVAITLGALIADFRWVVGGALTVFAAASVFIEIGVFHYLTINSLLAALIVVLGFASIANVYRRYQAFRH